MNSLLEELKLYDEEYAMENALKYLKEELVKIKKEYECLESFSWVEQIESEYGYGYIKNRLQVRNFERSFRDDYVRSFGNNSTIIIVNNMNFLIDFGNDREKYISFMNFLESNKDWLSDAILGAMEEYKRIDNVKKNLDKYKELVSKHEKMWQFGKVITPYQPNKEIDFESTKQLLKEINSTH